MTGTHHLVNGLFATRADWARYVVGRAGVDVEVVERPVLDLGATVAAAALGRPRPDAVAVGRAAPGLAGRDGRLRAGSCCARRASAA